MTRMPNYTARICLKTAQAVITRIEGLGGIEENTYICSILDPSEPFYRAGMVSALFSEALFEPQVRVNETIAVGLRIGTPTTDASE